MRYAKHLRDIGDNFRRLHLGSDDVADKTVIDEDWRKMEVGPVVMHCFVYCSL